MSVRFLLSPIHTTIFQALDGKDYFGPTTTN